MPERTEPRRRTTSPDPDRSAWMREPAHIDRRTFLRGSFGAGALLAFGAVLPATARAAESALTPPARLAVLSASAWTTLTHFAAYAIPRGGAFALGAADVDVAGAVDRWLEGADPLLVADLQRGLALLEWGPLLQGRALRPLSWLSREDADAWLASLPSSRFAFARDLHRALTDLCLLGFYSTPAAWIAVGYQGPWVIRSPESGRPSR